MRIYVKSKDRKLPIALMIPTSAIGWRWVWRLIGTAKGNRLSFLTGDTARQLAAASQRYVREYGHFDLVDMVSADGERVWIRI